MKKVILFIALVLLFSYSIVASDVTPEGYTFTCDDNYLFCDTFDASMNWSKWSSANQGSYTTSGGALTLASIGVVDNGLTTPSAIFDSSSQWCYESKTVSNTNDFYQGATDTGIYNGINKYFLADQEAQLRTVNSYNRPTNPGDGNNITIRLCRIGANEYNASYYLNQVLTNTYHNTTSSPLNVNNKPYYFGWTASGGETMFYIRLWAGLSSNDPAITVSNPTASITTPPTPADGYINNTLGQLIAGSCTLEGEPLIYFGSTTPPTTLVADYTGTQLTSGNWSINTSLVTTSDTYYYYVNCTNATSVASSIQTYIFDNVTPIETINGNNVFKSDNTTNLNNYLNNSLPINLSYTEDRDFYGFLLNVTYLNGTEIFSHQNETLSGTTYNYNTILDLNSLGVEQNNLLIFDRYTADSHTKNKIGDYKPKAITNAIDFNTEEGIYIKVESEDPATFGYEKLNDRYTIDVNFTAGAQKFTAGAQKKRKFFISSSELIRYHSNSNFLGHFTFLKSFIEGGNWLDFEGPDTTATVTKINDYLYSIELDKIKGKVKFKSLGGLNVLYTSNSYYYGNYSQYQSPDPALSEFTSSLYLNISKGGSVANLNACLTWNSTLYCNTTLQTNTSSYSLFSYNLPGVQVLTDTSINYNWNLTATQTDGSEYSFNTTTNTHNIKAWFIDDCSTANTTAFYIQIRDEATNNPLNSNLTASFEYYTTGSPATTKNYQALLYENNTFMFCKSPPSVSLTGDISGIISSPGYGTRTFSDFDVLLNGTFNAYLLQSTSTTAYITFTLQDSTGSKVEGASMRIFRQINGSDTLIYEGLSDFAGQITTFLDQLYKYDFTINTTNYPFKSFELQPTSTTYTITLSQTEAPLYENLYSGVRYKVSPTSFLFNVTDQYQNITFTVEGDNIEQIGINVSNHNFLCIPANCTSTYPGAGAVTVSLLLNDTGSLNVALWFTPTGESRVYVNDVFMKVVNWVFSGDNSLMDFLLELKQNTSPNTRTVLATIITTMVIGLGSAMGLFGALLLIPATFITIALSLPLQYQGVGINLINPLVGIIMSITMVAVYIFSQFGRD